MVNTAHLIPLFPFVAFLLNLFFGRRLREASAWVSIIASALSLVFAGITFQNLQAGHGSYTLGTWLTIHAATLNFGVTVDGLTVMMLLVVSIVATLIKIYSMGYMHGDPRFSRYFAYISLFTASMLGLVLADNFILLYIFWEGVGLCSYLLVSFWFEKPAAARAGFKAFITTRIGDTGFLIGIFLLFFATKTLNFADLHNLTSDNQGMLLAAALLIFCGAVGKSAQFPLHVWLPDAMEGPTAVSALIHAATMVAAGVYLVARTFPLFLLNPTSLEVVAVIGGISALMAATIATVNNDIKRVMAYSTISQLGLMMLGLGVGGYVAGTFHLMTHAFFKALLFLCAGSVIHAVHTQDIWKMGGLLPRMKITGWCFIIGSLALAGVPPFAGFWSKDEILAAAFNSGHYWLFAVAVLASFLTAFYMARLIFLVLFGKSRADNHAHESPASMTLPLIILAFFAMTVGFLGSPFMHHAFGHFILPGEAGEEAPNYFMMGVSTVISVSGILLGWIFYGPHRVHTVSVAPRNWLHKLLLNKYYFDEIYDVIFVRPTIALARFAFKFDASVVDDLVNGTAVLVQGVSRLLRPIQTGVVQNYMLVQIVGVSVLIVIILGRIWGRF